MYPNNKILAGNASTHREAIRGLAASSCFSRGSSGKNWSWSGRRGRGGRRRHRRRRRDRDLLLGSFLHCLSFFFCYESGDFLFDDLEFIFVLLDGSGATCPVIFLKLLNLRLKL